MCRHRHFNILPLIMGIVKREFLTRDLMKGLRYGNSSTIPEHSMAESNKTFKTHSGSLALGSSAWLKR